MAGPAARIVRIEGDTASLELARDRVERSGLRADEPLDAFAPGGGLVLLTREASRRGHLLASLGAVTVAEIFGLLGAGLRSGILVVQTENARRRLVLNEGQVVHASSTDLTERLGPVLWRHQMVDLPSLQRCETRVMPGVRLGKVLVDEGIITPAQLYRGVQLQVQEIALGAFVETEGELAFLEADPGDFETVKLIVRTRDLVLEGMRRAERVAYWRERYDANAVLTRTTRNVSAGSFEAAALYGAIDGQRTLREAARAARLGVYASLRALDELVNAGLVEAGERVPESLLSLHTPTPPPSAGPLERYRQALKRVADEVRKAGKLRRLESYFENLSLEHRGVLEGVRLNELGELDLAAVQANANKLYSGAMARAVALEAIDAFLSFALFDARNLLPADAAARLTRDLARILQGR